MITIVYNNQITDISSIEIEPTQWLDNGCDKDENGTWHLNFTPVAGYGFIVGYMNKRDAMDDFNSLVSEIRSGRIFLNWNDWKLGKNK